MNKKRIIIALVAGVIIFGGVLGVTRIKSIMMTDFFANMPPAVIAVTVEDVRREEWPTVVPAVGILRAINGVDVSAEVSGQVRSIEFESGMYVEEGQLLVQLDIQEETSQLTSARATENLANITADRARSLVRTSAGTKANLDDAVAQLEIAKSSATQIEARIAKKTIRAPFAGELGVRQVDLGEYVAPGQVMVNIQDLSRIYVDFTVSQRQIALVKTGAPIHLYVDAWPGRTFEGRITAVAPLVDVRTGMISVEGIFENSDGALRPGMLARVEAIQPERREVITAPMTAITYQLSGDTVYVLKPLPPPAPAKEPGFLARMIGTVMSWFKSDEPEDKSSPARREAEYSVKRTMVVVGDRQKDRIVIESGLNGDETIVTSGQMKLQSGSLVNISDTKLVPPDDPNKADISGEALGAGN